MPHIADDLRAVRTLIDTQEKYARAGGVLGAINRYAGRTTPQNAAIVAAIRAANGGVIWARHADVIAQIDRAISKHEATS